MCGQFIPKNSPNQTRAINNSICDRETVLLCQMATFRVKTTTAHMAEMTLNKKQKTHIKLYFVEMFNRDRLQISKCLTS